MPFLANLTSRGVVRTSGTLVRAEELGIVLGVLFLWAAAIALFINRWGKIRLMEPYHPYVETQSTPQTTNAVPPANINQQVMNAFDFGTPKTTFMFFAFRVEIPCYSLVWVEIVIDDQVCYVS